MTEDSLFLPGLSPVEGLDVHARFDGGALSSDGGVLLLREIELDLKFADTLAACLHDRILSENTDQRISCHVFA